MSAESQASPDSPLAQRGGRVRFLVVAGAAAVLLSLPVLGGIWLGRRPRAASAAATPLDLRAGLFQSTTVDAPAESNPRIEVRQSGQLVPLPNGGTFELGDGLNATVFVVPYPPTDPSLELDLYLTSANDQPVTDAVVSVEYDMLLMSHGPYPATTTNQNDGHYVTAFRFGMYGPWALDASLAMPGRSEPATLPLVIYVAP